MMTTKPTYCGCRTTEITRRRYDRIAPFYDALEWMAERAFYRRWRQALWNEVPPGEVLEVGIGTGKNVPHHADHHQVVGIDLSPQMLARARTRAWRHGGSIELVEADVQALPFADGTFDAVVSSFVFCSVPDPIRGLGEVRRVLKPGGRLLLLEHVVSHHRVLAWLMQQLDFVPRRIWGAHIDRDTVQHVQSAGFESVDVSAWFAGIFVRVDARRSGG